MWNGHDSGAARGGLRKLYLRISVILCKVRRDNYKMKIVHLSSRRDAHHVRLIKQASVNSNDTYGSQVIKGVSVR